MGEISFLSCLGAEICVLASTPPLGTSHFCIQKINAFFRFFHRKSGSELPRRNVSENLKLKNNPIELMQVIQIQIRHFYCATYTYSDQWRINNSQFS